MSGRKRRSKSDGCGCVYMRHPVTDAVITTLKWCETHRPRKSMTGRPIPKEGGR